MSITKKTISKYIARDGTEFDTLEAARAHNRLSVYAPLGWDEETINSVINGSNPALADAIEVLAHKAAKARRARGELKRPYPGRPASTLGQTAAPTGSIENPVAA